MAKKQQSPKKSYGAKSASSKAKGGKLGRTNLKAKGSAAYKK